MLSAGMFAARAVSRAAFRRMLAFGSPPFRAATVISRRILEKSLPRWTSVLPFLRLICDHRECPDTFAPLSALGRRRRRRLRVARQGGPEPLHARQPGLSPAERGLPAPPLAGRRRREGRARARAAVRPEMHEGQVGRARVADLARHGTSASTFTPISSDEVPTWLSPDRNVTTSCVATGA